MLIIIVNISTLIYSFKLIKQFMLYLLKFENEVQDFS